MLLIGSRATSIWHPEHKPKNPKDWDVLCIPAEASLILGYRVDASKFSWKHGNVELHNENFFLNSRIFDLYATPKQVEVPGLEGWPVFVISSRGLAAIKRSHMYRDFNFTKHMMQYLLLDHDFNEQDREFIRLRMIETKRHFPQRKVFGEMTNEEFVQDAVKRVVNHEEIHKVIAGGMPSYFQLKRDMSKAAYEHDLWHAASDEVRQACVREETYVIALERFLIPQRANGVRFSYRIAYTRALEKVCTTLDDGPLREYAIDNWNVVKLFDAQVFDRFFESELWRNYVEGRS